MIIIVLSDFGQKSNIIVIGGQAIAMAASKKMSAAFSEVSAIATIFA